MITTYYIIDENGPEVPSADKKEGLWDKLKDLAKWTPIGDSNENEIQNNTSSTRS